MIKTEIVEDELNSEEADISGVKDGKNKKNKAENVTFIPPARDYYLSILFSVVICLIAIGIYLLVRGPGSQKELSPTSHIGNVSALPLSSAGTSASSDNQAASDIPTLTSTSVNLQNNVPSGQGTDKTSSLQSTGNSLSTGQMINTNLPY